MREHRNQDERREPKSHMCICDDYKSKLSIHQHTTIPRERTTFEWCMRSDGASRGLGETNAQKLSMSESRSSREWLQHSMFNRQGLEGEAADIFISVHAPHPVLPPQILGM